MASPLTEHYKFISLSRSLIVLNPSVLSKHMSDISWIIKTIQDTIANGEDQGQLLQTLYRYYYMSMRIVHECLKVTEEPLRSEIITFFLKHDLLRRCQFPFHKRSAVLPLFYYCFRGDTGNPVFLEHLLQNIIIDDETKPYHNELITSAVRDALVEIFIGDALLKRQEPLADALCRFASVNKWPLRHSEIIKNMKTFYSSVYPNDDSDTRAKRFEQYQDYLKTHLLLHD
jgi:hypothetical protein